MTIEILPARLANQIAAGEVVERPASVVKELVENSLDAGATVIKVDIEKGGAKRIRISDNGLGIVKDELTLALSRHATSKIKNLNDLEGICSLGFRGEALASISSVSRLTLTSKPESQETAWQACAQGRDMEVTIQPAAHSQGTTIDVVDLFFNTPARRKFLRTEKTEFSHIEEVIKRIALARFDVAFTLTHNEKIVRQYRVATNENQKAKRVAQICGQTFINNALKVDCQHDGLTLTGWIARPSFYRNQNDICYSYVNGRMMRDKLINHAIRQSYQDMLPAETYPAFVLFLELDVRDVDVNVHPAKHEVRFHQGRYIHDFIYSVCHRSLVEENESYEVNNQETSAVEYDRQTNQIVTNNAYHQVNEYVPPLRNADQSAPLINFSTGETNYTTKQIERVPQAEFNRASEAYQSLMTPHQTTTAVAFESTLLPNLNFVAPEHAIYFQDQAARLVSLEKLERRIQEQIVIQQWERGFTSQPLLLPIKIQMSVEDVAFIKSYKEYFEKLGIVIQMTGQSSIQIRQYPSLLRHKDVNQSFTQLISELSELTKENTLLSEQHWQKCLSSVLNSNDRANNEDGEARLKRITQQLVQHFPERIIEELTLNSLHIDLKSSIEALT